MSWDELEFRSFTLLALVHEVRDDEFVCHLDPEFLAERTMVPHETLPPLDLPGLSGGPAFFVQSDPAEPIAPQLCATVAEGWLLDRNVIVKYARLDRVDRSGRIVEPRRD